LSSTNIRQNAKNEEFPKTTPETTTVSIKPSNDTLNSGKSAESENHVVGVNDRIGTNNSVSENVQEPSQLSNGTTSNPLQAVTDLSSSSVTVPVPTQLVDSAQGSSSFNPTENTSVTDTIQQPTIQQNQSTVSNEENSSNQNSGFSGDFLPNIEGTQNTGSGNSVFTPPPPPGS